MTLHDFLAVVVLFGGALGLTLLVIWLIDRPIHRAVELAMKSFFPEAPG